MVNLTGHEPDSLKMFFFASFDANALVVWHTTAVITAKIHFKIFVLRCYAVFTCVKSFKRKVLSAVIPKYYK